MRLLNILLTSLVFFVMFGLAPKGVWADWFISDCTDTSIGATVEGVGIAVESGTAEHTITVTGAYLPNGNYRIGVSDDATATSFEPRWYTSYVAKTNDQTKLSFSVTGDALIDDDPIGWKDTRHAYLYKEDQYFNVCKVGTYDVMENPRLTCDALEIYQYQKYDTDGDGIEEPEEYKCYSSGCIDSESKIFITGGNFKNRGDIVNWGALTFKCGRGGDWRACHDGYVSIINGQLKLYGTDISVNWGPGTWSYTPQSLVVGKNWEGACQGSLTILPSCPKSECHETFRTPKNPDEATVFELCTQINDPTLRTECQDCASSSDRKKDGQAGVWTAIGCIKRDPTSIMQRFIRLGLGIGGGVSLIMSFAGCFILTTSQGDPKRTGQAKEMITNAVIGLLFVIFSVTILQFIGYTVFKLPGFGK
ncbi:MAG: hypothetical protein O2840_04845 [bacterium]|nr:hypothetical protein [bacterium]